MDGDHQQNEQGHQHEHGEDHQHDDHQEHKHVEHDDKHEDQDLVDEARVERLFSQLGEKI